MTTSTVSRLGRAPEEGIKAPVKVSTIVDEPRQGSGILIDGVLVNTGDRVLVRSQLLPAQNGIYIVGPNDWERATDFNADNDVVNGQLVLDANSAILYQVVVAGPWDPGATPVTFVTYLVGTTSGFPSILLTLPDQIDLFDTNVPLNVGTTDPDTLPHTEFDFQGMQAKANINTVADLFLNPLGGDVRLGANLITGGTVDGINVSGHATDPTIHFTQAMISIPSTQISDFQTAVTATPAVLANTAKVSNVPTSLTTGTKTATQYGITSDGAVDDILLDTFTNLEAGMAPASGGGTANFLRADGTWDVPPGGSALPAGADTEIQFNDGGGAFGASADLTWDGTNVTIDGRVELISATSQLPTVRFSATAQAVDEKNWEINLWDDEFYIQAVDDSWANPAVALQINRGTGAAIGGIEIGTDAESVNISASDFINLDATNEVRVQNQLRLFSGTLYIQEQAAANADITNFGQHWVRSSDGAPMFTDEGGTDYQLNVGGVGDVTKVGTPVNNQIGVWTGDGTIEGDPNFFWDGPGQALTVNGNANFQDQVAINGTPGPASLNVVSTVSNARVNLDGPGPQLRFDQSGAGVDQKIWEINAESEELRFRVSDDSFANDFDWLTVSRSGTGAGVTVDDIAFVLGGNFTINGNVPLLEKGIDDNATAERLQLSDFDVQWGDGSATETWLQSLRSSTSGQHTISGGNSDILGGAIVLFGQTNSGNPGDVQLKSSDQVFFEWDESAGELEILTGIGAKTLAATFNASQELDLASNLSIPATSLLYLDGGGNTYLQESSDNVISFVTNGFSRMSISTATFQTQVDQVQFGDGGVGSQNITFQLNAQDTGDVVTTWQNDFSTIGRIFADSSAGEILYDVGALTAIRLLAAGTPQMIAPTTARASINLPHGTAPTTPNDGDMWTTTAGLFVRINGSTIGPLS